MESTQELLDKLVAGELDLSEISFLEFLQLAFLHAMDSNIINVDKRIIYGSNVFNVHCCVNAIEPQDAAYKTLSEKQ